MTDFILDPAALDRVTDLYAAVMATEVVAAAHETATAAIEARRDALVAQLEECDRHQPPGHDDGAAALAETLAADPKSATTKGWFKTVQSGRVAAQSALDEWEALRSVTVLAIGKVDDELVSAGVHKSAIADDRRVAYLAFHEATRDAMVAEFLGRFEEFARDVISPFRGFTEGQRRIGDLQIDATASDVIVNFWEDEYGGRLRDRSIFPKDHGSRIAAVRRVCAAMEARVRSRASGEAVP